MDGGKLRYQLTKQNSSRIRITNMLSSHRDSFATSYASFYLSWL